MLFGELGYGGGAGGELALQSLVLGLQSLHDALVVLTVRLQMCTSVFVFDIVLRAAVEI